MPRARSASMRRMAVARQCVWGVAAALLLAAVVACRADGGPADVDAQRVAAVLLARTGSVAEAAARLAGLHAACPSNDAVRADFAAVALWAGQPAVTWMIFTNWPAGAVLPDYVERAAARAARDLRRPADARAVYARLAQRNPSDADAWAGTAWTWMNEQRPREALAVLEEASRTCPDAPALAYVGAQAWRLVPDLTNALASVRVATRTGEAPAEALFLEAILLWDLDRHVEALAVYDRILARAPGNRAALNLKARLLSTMGCHHLARALVETEPAAIDPEVAETVALNRNAAYIRWREFERATNAYHAYLARDGVATAFQQRAQYDRAIALRAMQQMSLLTNVWADWQAREWVPASWAAESAADALLAQRRPSEALAIYEDNLAQDTNNANVMLAVQTARAELARYEDALDLVNEWDPRMPPWIEDRGELRYNWRKEQAWMARGWLEAYEERSKEAWEHFTNLWRIAPANAGVRSALAQLAYWRGWSSRAEEGARLVITRGGGDTCPRPWYEDDGLIGAQLTLAAAVGEQGRRSEARALTDQAARGSPLNTHAARATNSLAIQDAPRLLLDVVYTVEDSAAGNPQEYYVLLKGSDRLHPDLQVYGLYLRRVTEGETETYRRARAGEGAVWQALPALSLHGEASLDYRDAHDGGFLAAADVRLSDTQSAGLRHETFSLNVPLRAVAQGVEGRRSEAGYRWRPSELGEVRLGVGYDDLSDGNEHFNEGLTLVRALRRNAGWRNDATLEFGHDTFSLQDVPYFSPEELWTLELVHKLEHVIRRRYERAWVHRLFTGYGWVEQSGYDPEPIWDVKYEHDIRTSERTGLLVGGSYARRVYDGDPVDIYSIYGTFFHSF